MTVAVVATKGDTRRVHVNRPQDWGAAAGTDFWANWGDLTMADGASADLVANGWVTTGFSHAVGSGADFLLSSDVGITGGLNFDTANDLLQSPFIFGDFAHGQMVAGILGYTPTTLNMECFARFAAGNNEEASGFGFLIAGASGAIVKADLAAFIAIDGTDFSLEDVNGADAGATKDTAPHLFRVSMSGTTTEWFIDGTSQGTLTMGLDEWPACWGAGSVTANDPVISWVHIWYA